MYDTQTFLVNEWRLNRLKEMNYSQGVEEWPLKGLLEHLVWGT
jgi:hypothetical protein